MRAAESWPHDTSHAQIQSIQLLLTVGEFTDMALRALPTLVRRLQDETGRFGAGEEEAWRSSLRSLAGVLNTADLAPFHVHLAKKRDGELSLEYRLPASSSWCDVVLLGRGPARSAAVILELKNWQVQGDKAGPRAGLVWHNGNLVLHPSEQVRGYTEYCRRFHSAVESLGADVRGCTVFTNARETRTYRAAPYAELTAEFPVFSAGRGAAMDEFPRFLQQHLTAPDADFATAFEHGRYSQDRDFVRSIAGAILRDQEPNFVLLDGQILGFERCLNAVDETLQAGDEHKAVIVIEGPPGSGKSVLAARLWAKLVEDTRLDGNVVLVSTSGSQKANWRSLFADVTNQAASSGVIVPANEFNPGLTPKWVNEQRTQGASLAISEWRENLAMFESLRGPGRMAADQMAVAIVDEAHGLIDPTAEGAEGVSPSGWALHAGPQAWHIIRASRISIFLLDPDQSYRDNETTTVSSLRQFAKEHGARLEEVSLAGAQFRCAGSTEYVDWVGDLLAGGSRRAPASVASAGAGDARFTFELADTPADLETRLREIGTAGKSTRLLASYARPWLTKLEPRPHSLPAARMDFRIPYKVGAKRREWSRIWNFAPGQDYTLFVRAPAGSAMQLDPLSEVGCPYVVRGFDWDYGGVLWLSDLVWRTDRWVAQLDHVFESAWRKSLSDAKKEAKKGEVGPATDRLRQRLARGYRILLTRAIRGVVVWCEDEETKSHLASLLQSADE